MPTIMRIGSYRFFFFSEEGDEPVHVHVIREQTEAKFWMKPTVRVAMNEGFAQHELRKIARLVEENREFIAHEWNKRKKTS
jgi:3-methyladenine DNA glycosylase AlkD